MDFGHLKVLTSEFKMRVQQGKVKSKNILTKIFLPEYIESDLNEAQIRQSFILPLINILGWNPEDPFEVSPEERSGDGYIDIRTNIDGIDSVIWEIKRTGYDLNLNTKSGKEAAYQAVGYARTFNNSPYCILTNFDIIHIFHSYNLPAREKISDNKIASFSWLDLEKISSQNFLKTFSKESIKKETYRKILDKMVKNGSVIYQHIPLQKAILKDLESMRLLLTQAFWSYRLNDWKVSEIDYATQKFINRILFIKSCEDRNLVQSKIIQNVLTYSNIWNKLRTKTFPDFKKKFNSDIFEKNEILDHSKFNLSDDLMKSIISYCIFRKGLDILEVYDYSIIPLEILGYAYENFIGHKAEINENNKIEISIKPELKKSGGVCYTPLEVVNIIVKNSFKECKSKSNQLRILDPACGSGTFLISSFRELIFRDTVKPYRKGEKSIPPTLDKKIKILKEYLFGVDIDKHAVEITKFSLFLCALDGEKKLPQFHNKMLPTLDKNIQCGDSLIDHNMTMDSDLKKLKNIPFNWEYSFKISPTSKFDIIVMNPPYIRMSILQDYFPEEVTLYKKNYESLSVSGGDIYLAFIEKSYDLLTEGGSIGLICPHRFFVSDYGKYLRKNLAINRSIKKIINFRAHQIFEGVTTYTTIMVITKYPNKNIYYSEIAKDQKISNFFEKLNFEKQDYSTLSSDGPWLMGYLGDKELVNRIEGFPFHFRDLMEKSGTFQGMINGADNVYIIELKEDGYWSKELSDYIDIEEEMLIPLLKGSKDLKFLKKIVTKRYLIFPYQENETEKKILVPAHELKKNYPLTYQYFKRCEWTLRIRRGLMPKAKRNLDIENYGNKMPRKEKKHIWVYIEESFQDKVFGKVKTHLNEYNVSSFNIHDDFYRYSRNQAINSMGLKKCIIPSICKKFTIAFDSEGKFSSTGSGSGGGGAYGIFLSKNFIDNVYFYIGLLSSSLYEKWFERRADLYNGYYLGTDEELISKIPLPDISKIPKKIVRDLSKLTKQIYLSGSESQFEGYKYEIDALVDQIFETLSMPIAG